MLTGAPRAPSAAARFLPAPRCKLKAEHKGQLMDASCHKSAAYVIGWYKDRMNLTREVLILSEARALFRHLEVLKVVPKLTLTTKNNSYYKVLE